MKITKQPNEDAAAHTEAAESLPLGRREFIEAISRAYEEPDPEEEEQQRLMRALHRRAIEVEDDW